MFKSKYSEIKYTFVGKRKIYLKAIRIQYYNKENILEKCLKDTLDGK